MLLSYLYVTIESESKMFQLSLKFHNERGRKHTNLHSVNTQASLCSPHKDGILENSINNEEIIYDTALNSIFRWLLYN